ncbi:MAG: T9SS C-terminal target domain-containing protein, partial [Bacteroidetes bacterium]
NNEATVKLRVDHSYKKDVWNRASGTGYNNGYPAYSFNTNNIAAKIGHNETAVSALDLIRVVPNPYYAYSAYESDQLDNRVRITNLPERCTIKIFATNGTLVRTYSKDETNTWIDWDLKNQANIPIASGVYYIHVNAPGIGEKIIKWFGVLRPIDLNAF